VKKDGKGRKYEETTCAVGVATTVKRKAEELLADARGSLLGKNRA